MAVLISLSGCDSSSRDAGPAARAVGTRPAATTGATAPTEDFTGRVDVGGGREIYLRCAGTEGPTVILVSGLHDSSDIWQITDTRPPVPKAPAVFPGVAGFTRVCAYDRPGTIRYTPSFTLTRRSTPQRGTRSLTAMVDDLDRLLTTAHVPAPYLLVGHSFGGMITRLYAQTHPERTAGLVFVDAFGTDIKQYFGRHWPAYVQLLNNPGTALDKDPGFEKVGIDGAIAAVERARPLPEVPLAVVSKTEPFAVPPGTPKPLAATLERAWPQVQRRLVDLEPQTPQFLATGSDHYVPIHDPDLTISAIKLVLGRVDADSQRSSASHPRGTRATRSERSGSRPRRGRPDPNR